MLRISGPDLDYSVLTISFFITAPWCFVDQAVKMASFVVATLVDIIYLS